MGEQAFKMFPRDHKQREINNFINDLMNPKIVLSGVLVCLFALTIFAGLDWLLLNQLFSSAWNVVFYGSIVLMILFVGNFTVEARRSIIRKRMPTIKIADADAGEVEIVGEFQTANDSKVSPFFCVDCLGFKSSISLKERKKGKNKGYRIIHEFSEVDGFDDLYLKDKTGIILISEIDCSEFTLCLSERLSTEQILPKLQVLKDEYMHDSVKHDEILSLTQLIESRVTKKTLFNQFFLEVKEEVILGNFPVMLTGEVIKLQSSVNEVSSKKINELVEFFPQKSEELGGLIRNPSRLETFANLHEGTTEDLKILTKLPKEEAILWSTTFMNEDRQIKTEAIGTILCVFICLVAMNFSYS